MYSFAQEFRNDWSKLPNLTTGIRLVLSPLPGTLIMMYPTDPWYRLAAMAAFVIIVATDAIDGYLARSRNEVTTLGKLLDPAVDKALVVLTLIALSIVDPILWVPTVIIIAREASVTYIRVQAKRKGVVVAAIQSGKAKMVMQSVAIALLLMSFGGIIWQVATVTAVISAIGITIASWIEYHCKFS